MKVKVQTLDGGKAGSDIELNDDVFGVEPRADILHRVVTWQLEKRRGTARGARERSRRRPHRQEVRPPEGRRHRPSRRSPRPDLRRRRQGARPPRPRLQSVAEQEGPRARPEDGALGQGQGRQSDRARQSRPQGSQDHGAEGAARQARLRQDRAGDRRRRAQRRLRPGLVEPRARSTCCRRSAPTSTTFSITRPWC